MSSPAWPPRGLDSPSAKTTSTVSAMDEAGIQLLDSEGYEKSPLQIDTGDTQVECPSLIEPVHASTPPRMLPFVESETESESDQSQVKAPKGRLAAELQVLSRSSSAQDNGQAVNSETAYERIKRQLMESAPQEPQPGKEMSLPTSHESSTDSEREDFPVRRHRLKRKLASTRSPSIDHPKSPGSEATRQASPGLFVSPPPSPRQPSMTVEGLANDSESDSSIVPSDNPRLRALVAKRRQELREKGAFAQEQSSEEEEPAPPSRAVTTKPVKKTVVTVEAEDNDEPEMGMKLTQQARPTRKAGKKALEEMHRETQRISRNMQLTHQAKTKTKFSQDAFFSRFNFKRADLTVSETVSTEVSSSSPPAAASDTEDPAAQDTPPSSPLSAQGHTNSEQLPKDIAESHSDISTLEPAVMSYPIDMEVKTSEAPPGPTDAISKQIESNNLNHTETKKPSVRKLEKTRQRKVGSDSDDDLEIIEARLPSRLPVFDELPKQKAQEPHSLLQLRALAYLNDRSIKGVRPKNSMTRTELNAKLHQNSRRQALLEREEKIQRAKEKGIDIQTTEEKEKQQLEIENLLERARHEAEALAQREKEAAKKEGKGGEDNSGLPDSEDEEWKEDENENNDEEGAESDEEENEGSVELSGSEDEQEASDQEMVESDGDDEAPDEVAEGAEQGVSLAIKDMSVERDIVSDNEQEAYEKDSQIDESETAAERVLFKGRQRIRKVITSDDEDEEADLSNKHVRTPVAGAQQTENDPSADPFSFVNSKPASLGLSQIFAGTMAETQTQEEDARQDRMELLRGPPVEHGLEISTPPIHPSEELLVQDSQAQEAEKGELNGVTLFETQSQVAFMQTQLSELPEATQDIGFQDVADSQITAYNASYSTVDTVILEAVKSTEPETSKKRARLRKRGEVRNNLEDSVEEVSESRRNAFLVMQDASKTPAELNSFDKKKSGAKEMVEEQAEESEDEYAGLGGASDDESTGELDEDTKGMIDDESNEKLNEREIAAFYANKARAEDEKDIANLYKDIVNGGLRRKRGAEMDLWDPDDEDEIAARRRENKQREFAKMRKALLADEKLGKIAENPKQAAFLQAIEDRAEDDYFDILEVREESISQVTDSQNGVSTPSKQVLVAVAGNGNKRSWDQFVAGDDEQKGTSQQENPPHPNTRRKTAYTKPTSLADIRHTLSELIGEPESIAETQELLSSEESENERRDSDDEEMDEDDLAFIDDSRDLALAEASAAAARRVPASAARSAVIDRMALKRAASSSVNASNDDSTDRLAFHAPSKSSAFSFKVPSLLRRATSSSTVPESQGSANRSVNSSVSMGGGDKQAVKMGGSKKSSVNYYVREQERKSRLELVEKEIIEGRERVGKMRRQGMSSALGALVSGKFS